MKTLQDLLYALGGMFLAFLGFLGLGFWLYYPNKGAWALLLVPLLLLVGALALWLFYLGGLWSAVLGTLLGSAFVLVWLVLVWFRALVNWNLQKFLEATLLFGFLEIVTAGIAVYLWVKKREAKEVSWFELVLLGLLGLQILLVVPGLKLLPLFLVLAVPTAGYLWLKKKEAEWLTWVEVVFLGCLSVLALVIVLVKSPEMISAQILAIGLMFLLVLFVSTVIAAYLWLKKRGAGWLMWFEVSFMVWNSFTVVISILLRGRPVLFWVWLAVNGVIALGILIGGMIDMVSSALSRRKLAGMT